MRDKVPNPLPMRLRSARCRLAGALVGAVGLIATYAAGAIADPIFTDSGRFIVNKSKGTVTMTSAGGGTTTLPALVRERQKPGTADKAEPDGAVPQAPYTAAQITAINNAVTTTYPGVTIVTNPDPYSDCHGLTFKSGKYFIDNAEVQKIIDDQGWKAPADGKAKVGDIVIYKKNGVITHSGIVQTVDDKGNVTKIRSKWGPWGTYDHAPGDVPKGQPAFGGVDYGAFTVLTGGKPLKDPPADAATVTAFANIPEVHLKTSLLLDNPINILPVATLSFDGHSGGSFDYSLDTPGLDLPISPGDTVSLFAAGLTGASVSASGWIVQSVTPDVVTWVATAAGLLDHDLSGFDVTSIYTTVRDTIYRETIGGSVGLLDGPAVPEPPTLVLLATGMVLFAGGLRLSRAARVQRSGSAIVAGRS